MAVIVSNGATSLSTASGFYRAEAHNLGMFSTTELALSSTRTIAVTFANAGACQGLILCCVATTGTLAANLKSVVVTLQENVASVWTDRATVTLSAASISNSSTIAQGAWIVPFSGGTFPYTVTTAASTWRFQVSQSGAQSTNWSLRTSDATNPFYVTWCNNAMTFANDDTVICKDVVTIDQTAKFKGLLGTGDTTRSVACIICRGSSGLAASVANLVWANPPAASYTLTLDGLVIRGADSGFRIGTAASPISVANQAIVDIIAATSGTATNSGFSNARVGGSWAPRDNLLLYGDYPAVRKTTLTASAAAGQPVIVTADATAWPLNTRVFIGGNTAQGAGDSAVYTVSTAVGTTVTLTGNLSAARSAAASVVRLDGFGIVIKAPSATNITNFCGRFSNLAVRGVLFQHNNWVFIAGSTLDPDDAAVLPSEQFIEFSAVEMPASPNPPTNSAWMGNILSHRIPLYLRDMAVVNYPVFQYQGSGAYVTGSPFGQDSFRVERVNNLRVSGGNATNRVSSAVDWRGWVRSSTFEGGTSGACLELSGAGYDVSDNVFWGNNWSAALNFTATSAIPTFARNVYNNCTYGIRFSGTVVGMTDSGSSFGQTVALTGSEAWVQGAGYIQATFVDPVGNVRFLAGFTPANAAPASRVSIQNNNSTTNNDISYLFSGIYQRTGTGLTDTTARTAGGYAIRLAPNSGTNLLAWPNLVSERSVPTGNIQSKTMTVTCWVYINNAAYYAGTNTLPTLSVKYDNTTTATSVATATAGGWQQLAVTFTPTTTYGQIEIWLSGATDAAGANAYWYVDDVQVAYPAGVSINLGGLDLWANATPVWPPIATVPALGGVWDEATSAHGVAGSFGEKVQALATSAAVAAVQSALAGTLTADVRYVKGIQIDGTGTDNDPWGPV
jgi:hypothetical protein